MNIKKWLCEISGKHTHFIPGTKPGDIKRWADKYNRGYSQKFRCKKCGELV